MEIPTAFISYSHDSDEHKNWVLGLANRLVKNGVNAILDQYDLALGGDLPTYMENGLSVENRVLCICSERYTTKANRGEGGVGYEKMIMTGELLRNIDTKWIIPVLRNNSSSSMPKFLTGKIFADFNKDVDFEIKYELLLRELLGIPHHPKPELGQSPFIQIKETGRILFRPQKERFYSPGYSGVVKFDFSSNNGRYTIGDGELTFELHISKKGPTSMHVYNFPDSIDCIAIAYNIKEIEEIEDAYQFDYTSNNRSPEIGEIVLWQNKNGYFAATKILSIKNRYINGDYDEVVFEYRIQTNATGNFSNL